jgi:hypothetical protein
MLWEKYSQIMLSCLDATESPAAFKVILQKGILNFFGFGII